MTLRPFTAAIVALTLAARGLVGAEFMFVTQVDGVELEGRPLTWSDSTMALLARDGQLHQFHPKRAKQAHKTAPTFAPYTMEEMRQRLYHEFSDAYEFTSTNHYLVVHPAGEQSQWADRFEDLYRSFTGYFRVRGFTPQEPAYPLVAVVFPNRAAYDQYVQVSAVGAPAGALGHYEPQTNRVYLFDTPANDGDNWTDSAATVIHEATHQTAFNVGVHSRFTTTPRWVTEGLATMFEARGVHDTRSYDRREDRVNRGRFADYQAFAAQGALPTLEKFIATDDAFRDDLAAAYAHAWALSFFLCETRPREYSAYLAATAARPMFSDYSAQGRLWDFSTAFGDDLSLLDAHFRKFMAKVR